MKKLTTILIMILLLFNIQVSAENYESIIITKPEGTFGQYVPKEDEMYPSYGDTLPVGTRLTNVKTEEPCAGFDCVSGFTYDGKQYIVFRKDTSLENIYPSVDEAQINLASTPDELPIWPWIVFIIVVVIGVGILSAYLQQPQCPKCKSRGSREVKRQFLNKE